MEALAVRVVRERAVVAVGGAVDSTVGVGSWRAAARAAVATTVA